MFVSETVRNGNKCKNMLFWQVIIFNTKTESISSFVLPFLGLVVDFLFLLPGFC